MDLEKKISVSTRIGYSIGSIGDSAAYNFIITFLSFFLTTRVGINPILAGSIIGIAIIWDAIADPILGLIVDHSKSQYGKRRPFILASIAPLAIATFMLFIKIDLPTTFQSLYYLLMVLIFWTSYTLFSIPYYSLGSVLSYDDDERTKLSAYREVAGFIGIFCGTSIPTFFLGLLVNRGIKENSAWLYVALIVAVITAATIAIMWRMTRGKELHELGENDDKPTLTIKEGLAQLWSLTKNKSYLIIIFSALFFNIYLTLFNADIMYYTKYVLNISEGRASILFTVMTACSIVFIPFITRSAIQFDKRLIFIGTMMFSGIVMIFASFFKITSLNMALVYVVLVSVGTSAYWMFIFNLLYDVVDIDEFREGRRRDGIILSYYSFLLKLGGALASQVLGIILSISGFNIGATDQSTTAMKAINNLFTLYPGIFMFLSGLVVLLSPASKKRLHLLKQALSKRASGQPYDTNGFEKLLK